MQGEGLFSHDRQPNAAAFRVAKSRIQELILQRPTDYSQSQSVARMMLGAYGSKDVEKLVTEEYEWSEIFPIGTMCFAYEVHCDGKRFFKLPQINRGDETLHKCGYNRAQQLAKEPLRSTNNDQKISKSILGFTNLLPLQSYGGLDEAEMKRMIKCNQAQDSENTGLIIKLPEIVNSL